MPPFRDAPTIPSVPEDEHLSRVARQQEEARRPRTALEASKEIPDDIMRAHKRRNLVEQSFGEDSRIRQEGLTAELPKDLNLDAVVPSTGERYSSWLDRRFDTALKNAPGFGPRFALEVASSNISDEELTGLTSALARGNELLSKAAEDEHDEFANARIVSEILSMSNIRQARAEAVTRIMAGGRVVTSQDRLDSGARAYGYQDFNDMVLQTAAQRVKAEDLKAQGRLESQFVEALDKKETAEAARMVALRMTGGNESDETAKRLGFDSFDALVANQASKLAGAVAVGSESPVVASLGQGALGAAATIFEPLEKVYRQISRPVGFAAQYVQEGLEVAVAPITHALELLPGKQFKDEVLTFNPPSPAEAWKRVVEQGPGKALAIQGGAEPGSLEFHISSAAIDFAFRSFLDPGAVVGKVARGAKAARTVFGTDESLKGISRWVNKALASDDPRQLFTQGPGKRGVEALAADIRDWSVDGVLNKNRLARKWNLHAGLLDSLERTGGKVDEVVEVLAESARGRASGQMVAGWKAELSKIDEEIGALQAATPEQLLTTPALAGGLSMKEGLLLLKQRRAQLNELIQARRSPTALRTVPQDTFMARLRDTLKRPDLKTVEGRFISFFTDPNWSRADSPTRRHARGKLPRPVNPFDKQAGRTYIERSATLLGLRADEVDAFANRYLNVTSNGELFQLFTDLAAAGRKNLPEGVPSELTQWVDTPGAIGYWTGTDAKSAIFQGWSHTDDAGRVWEQPILSTQRLRAMPGFDWSELIKARTWTGKLINRLRKAEGGLATRRAANKLADGIQFTQRIAGKAISAWAIGALLRVGWAIKINTEEMVRLFAIGTNPLEDNIFSVLSKGSQQRTRALGKYALVAGDPDLVLPPPEDMLANYGGAVAERRAIPQMGIPKGRKGYHEAVQDSLAQLYSAREVQQLARHGKEKTVAWLLDPLGGRQILDDQLDVIFKTRGEALAALSGEELIEGAAREWVNALDEIVQATVGKSDRLKRVLKDGYLTVEGGRIGIDDSLFVQELRQMPLDELPHWGRPSGTSWQYGGKGEWREGVSKIMNAISATPSNKLNRIPAYRHFYRAEIARMRKLGVPDELANQEARNYAARQVSEFLYDGAQRTATDEQVRNFIAFFPAYKEVATRWLGTIPASMGIGVGHGVIARKATLFFDALVKDGLVVKNEDGDWVLRYDGLDGLLGYALGVVGIKGEFNFKNLSFISGLPGLTPLGEGGLQLIGKFVGGSKPYEEFVNFLTDGFGLNTDLTPTWMGRLLRFAGMKFGLSKFSTDYQDEQTANAIIDVLRTEMADEFFALRDKWTVERSEDFSAATRVELEAEALDLWKRAEQRAAGVLLRRSMLGVLSPWQPRLIWPGQDEADAFYKAAESIPVDGDRSILDRMIQANPKMELFLFSKTVKLRGAEAHEESRDAYWNELMDGTRESLGPDWIFFALGAADYSSIRRQQRADLAKLGDSAADWLRNGWKYREIQRTFSEKFEKLQLIHPKWWEVFQQKLDEGAVADGKPLPDVEEQIVMQASQLSRILEFKFADPFSEHGGEIAADIRKVNSQLMDLYDLEQFYEKDRLVPGPERELARYYSEVVGPYWDQVADIRERYIEGEKPKASIREGYRRLTELRNTSEPAFTEAQRVQTVYVQTDDLASRQLVTSAIRTWNEATGAEVFRFGGLRPPGLQVEPNSVTFAHEDAEDALGDFDPSTRIIRATETFTLEHELAHAVGLDHFKDDVLDTTLPAAIEAVRRAAGVDLYPHPEEATYLMAHPNEKRRREMSWAMGRVEWMAPFQRRVLGMKGDTELATEYWGVVEDWREQVNTYLKANDISRQSNRGKGIVETVESRARTLAELNGLGSDYLLSQRPPFERAARLGLFKDNDGDIIQGTQRLLDGFKSAQAFLRAEEKGPTTNAGREVVLRFSRWMSGLRVQFPALDDRLSEFFTAAPDAFRKSVDVNFVPFFFFGVTSPYGVE